MAKVKERNQSTASNHSGNGRSSLLPFDLPLPGSMLVRRPGADEAKDTVLSTAQRAVERARGAAGAAIEQLPESLAGVPVPRRKQRHGPPKLLIVGLIAAVAAGGFMLYRWLSGPSDADYGIDHDWPAEPNYGPTNEPHEDDRQAEMDAEQSVATLTGGAYGTPPNSQTQQ